jgi:hypothetical protein
MTKQHVFSLKKEQIKKIQTQEILNNLTTCYSTYEELIEKMNELKAYKKQIDAIWEISINELEKNYTGNRMIDLSNKTNKTMRPCKNYKSKF